MPELYLKKPGFTYSACGPFTTNKERIEKFIQTRSTNCIYRNELDKACVQHVMAYGKSKYLAKSTQSETLLRDKAFKIASDPKYDGYQRGLASMVYTFFFIGRLLEDLKDEKFIHRLETVFGLLI